MLAHVHPSQLRFTCETRAIFHGQRFPPAMLPGPPTAHQVPRAPLPATGVTSYGVISSTTSEGITPPSSLIRAHAPDQFPPADFALLNTAGLCRLSPVPAGKWPFPALSPQSLYRRLDPYPAAPPRCTRSFLPERLRPHLRGNKFGTPNTRRNATSTAGVFSELQSFLYVQAPILARPPGCTHR